MFKITRMLENGPVELQSRTSDGERHRSVRVPGEDISDLSPTIQQEITAHWTPERVAAYEETIREQLSSGVLTTRPRRTTLTQLEATVRELDARITALETGSSS